MRRLLLFSLLLATLPATAQQHDPELQRQLQDLVSGFGGRVGVYVQHLPTGRTASVAADSVFPTASMIKVPILVQTFAAIEQGKLAYRQPLLFRDSLRYGGSDLSAAWMDSTEVPLDQVALLMITMSDNTASLWLQELCGSGVAINQWLSSNGFVYTRMNSRTPGRRPNWERYGWGQSTPREMADLMTRIREGRAVSPAADERMYRMLTRSYWDDEALSAIPPTVQAASKQGAVSAARSEVVIVEAPHGPYVLAVMTDEQSDTRWTHDNEGAELIRALSALFWKTFEPYSDWMAAPGIDAYR